MKKYEILHDDSISFYGETLYRVRALRSFGDVKEGDTGGYVESEENLSHDGTCWVYDDAKVWGNAIVQDDAKVKGKALVHSHSEIFCSAQVGGSALVINASIYDRASVCGYSEVEGGCISGQAMISGNAKVSWGCFVTDDAKVGGYARIRNGARINGFAEINSDRDFQVFTNVGYDPKVLTVYRTKDGGVEIDHGGKTWSIKEFTDWHVGRYAVDEKTDRLYQLLLQEIKLWFEL